MGLGGTRVGSPARTARNKIHTHITDTARRCSHAAPGRAGGVRGVGQLAGTSYDSRGREETGRIRSGSRDAVSGLGRVRAGRGLFLRGEATSLWREPVRNRRSGQVAILGELKTDEGLRKKGAWWMPWRWRPRKDAATRRNALGRRWQPEIQGCPNGATRPAHGRAPRSDPGRAPGELKHLSTPRKREDSLSSGERTGRSPNPAGGIACRRCLRGVERASWRGRQFPRLRPTTQLKTAGTGHRRG